MTLIKYTILNLSIFISLLAGQDFDKKIKAAYDAFQDNKLDSLLIEANSVYTQLLFNDKIAFHQYSAFRAFQNGNNAIAFDHFSELIALNPGYILDPVNTSPKLITLFDKAKIAYLEQQQVKLKKLAEIKRTSKLTWQSYLVPGWEQWQQGAKTKAYIWGSLGAITLVGTTQAIIRTAAQRQKYLDAREASKVSREYDSYNALYQTQYYWAYGMAAVWLGSHLDTVFFTTQKNVDLTIQPDNQTGLALSLNIHF